MKKIMALLLALSLIFSLTACFNDGVESTNTVSTTQTTSESSVAVITLGDTITVSGSGATVNGSTVNITDGGTYSISGSLANGQVNVNTTEKVYIELNGVTITNNSGPALCITDAKKVTVTLVVGTMNYLTDADNNGDDDATLFTNDTLVIEGDGTLIVTGGVPPFLVPPRMRDFLPSPLVV